MAMTGVDGLQYAILSKDEVTGVTYGEFVKIPGTVKIDVKPASNSASIYADNAPYATATSLGDIDVEIELANFTLEDQAALLGHRVDAKGVMVSAADDIAPYTCFAFRGLKDNDKYMYVKLLKGKFQEPETSNETKGDSPKFGTATLKGKFVARTYDKAWKRVLDADAKGYTAGDETAFMASVEPKA